MCTSTYVYIYIYNVYIIYCIHIISNVWRVLHEPLTNYWLLVRGMNFISAEHACSADDDGPGGVGVGEGKKNHNSWFKTDGWRAGAVLPRKTRTSLSGLLYQLLYYCTRLYVVGKLLWWEIESALYIIIIIGRRRDIPRHIRGISVKTAYGRYDKNKRVVWCLASPRSVCRRGSARHRRVG